MKIKKGVFILISQTNLEIFPVDSFYSTLIIMVVLFFIAVGIGFMMKIHNLKAISLIFAILLVISYAFEILSQLYAIIGFLIFAVVVYIELNQRNGGTDENG